MRTSPEFGNSEFGRLTRVALRHPAAAFRSQAAIDRQWMRLNYLDRPDFQGAVREYDRFMDILTGRGVELVMLQSASGLGLDSIYVRDATIHFDGVAAELRMTKAGRRSEPSVNRALLEAQGIHFIGHMSAPGRLEGGDVVWLDDRIVAVGLGRRSNREGIRQFKDWLGQRAEVISVKLQPFRDKNITVHLSTAFNVVGHKKAIYFPPIIPHDYYRWLRERDWTLYEMNEAEFLGQAGCLLALDDGVIMTVSRNSQSIRLLQSHGLDVLALESDEICVKGQGGFSCLTRPLWREAVLQG